MLCRGTALLQYVDDLLIAAPTQEQCQRDTVLKHLAPLQTAMCETAPFLPWSWHFR